MLFEQVFLAAAQGLKELLAVDWLPLATLQVVVPAIKHFPRLDKLVKIFGNNIFNQFARGAPGIDCQLVELGLYIGVNCTSIVLLPLSGYANLQYRVRCPTRPALRGGLLRAGYGQNRPNNLRQFHFQRVYIRIRVNHGSDGAIARRQADQQKADRVGLRNLA